MKSVWRIEMLGKLQAESGEAAISRFRTRRVSLLLAYLAYYPKRRHSREELTDLLWPDCESEAARRNFRQALSSLRHHLEPPSLAPGSIVVAKQGLVSINPELVTTDVTEFGDLVESANQATSNAEKIARLTKAIDLYCGDFLPGFYDDWVQRERLHLEDQLVSALQTFVQVCVEEGRNEEAIKYVRLALAKDHLREDLHASLMRLYLACGRPHSALQHYRDWKDTLATELSEEPSEVVVDLAARAERDAAISWTPSSGGSREKTAPDSVFRGQEEPRTVSSLPLQMTRFFGRRDDRMNVIQTVAEKRVRLVTLTGSAGSGKTRLSIEVGKDLAQIHGWNVWFLPLADLSDGSTALHALAEAMKLHLEHGNTPIEMLNSHLFESNNLLILDNLEHIIDEIAPIVEELLHRVPGISILATSRQALKLGGEHEIDLGALPVPHSDQIEECDLRKLSLIPSVQLFLDRAQAVVPDFQITRHNARAIASICVQLDGIPLALEFAAGIANAFTPSHILQNLESRLEILRNRRRDIPNRHRTLRAAIDYSYDLLSPELQRFFVELSVFRGGFTVEAASQICFPDSSDLSDAAKRRHDACLGMILDLKDRSLLRMDDSSNQSASARFRLLESFREYGVSLMTPEQSVAIRDRHADYFLHLGKLGPQAGGASGVWDRDNRLAALQYFFENGRVHECVKLLESMHGFTMIGRETILAFARSPDFDTFDGMDQILIMRLLADVQLYPSEFEDSLRAARKGLEIATRLGLEEQMAICHRSAALAAFYLGLREEAISHDEEFLKHAQKVGEPRKLEAAYNALGTNRWTMGDLNAALEAFEAGWKVSVEAHNGEPIWPILYNLSRVHLDFGNLDEGLRYASEGLRITQHRSEEFGISMFLGLISRNQLLRGNLAGALATSREALVKRRKVGFRYWTLCAIQGHAAVLVRLGHYAEAATLLAASRDTLKLRRELDDREYAANLETTKANLSESEFEEAWARGIAMGVEEAYRMATHGGG